MFVKKYGNHDEGKEHVWNVGKAISIPHCSILQSYCLTDHRYLMCYMSSAGDTRCLFDSFLGNIEQIVWTNHAVAINFGVNSYCRILFFDQNLNHIQYSQSYDDWVYIPKVEKIFASGNILVIKEAGSSGVRAWYTVPSKFEHKTSKYSTKISEVESIIFDDQNPTKFQVLYENKELHTIYFEDKNTGQEKYVTEYKYQTFNLQSQMISEMDERQKIILPANQSRINNNVHKSKKLFKFLNNLNFQAYLLPILFCFILTIYFMIKVQF